MTDQRSPLLDYEDKHRELVPARREEKKRSGCLGASAIMGTCLVMSAACLGIPILAVVFTLVTGTNTLTGIIDSVVGIFNPPTTATVTSSPTIVRSIQPLGQLVSISAEFAKADIRVSVRDGFQNACGRSARHVAQGSIDAGVDLNQVGENDISYDPLSQTYTITLPPPQLTSCSIEYLDQYSRSTSACGTDWDNLRLMAQYEALREFRDDAIEGGILDRARDEAEITLRSFLQPLTGRNVVIRFREPDPDAPAVFPARCQPIPPPGWNYHPDQDYWSN